MEYVEHYDNLAERKSLCQTAETNGYRMLHDDFDPDWEVGDPPHGNLTFTNSVEETSPPSTAEELKLEIKEIKNRIKALEDEQ